MAIQPKKTRSTGPKIVYRQNGFRVFSAKDALQILETHLTEQSISFVHKELHQCCDLGFYVDLVQGYPGLKYYTRQSSNHYGKGPSKLQAKLSALFEAVERYSSMYTDECLTLHGSYRQLTSRGNKLYNPNDHLMPTQSIIESDEHFAADVKTVYNEDLSIKWFGCESPVSGENIYLPICMTHTLHLDDTKNRIFTNRPNGLSSGMIKEEAILQGLMELIERDAECIFVGNSLPMPKIALSTIDNTLVQTFIKKANKADVQVVIKNISTDLCIPTFYVLLFDRKSDHCRICWGCGSHFSKKIALAHAITEACQDRAAQKYLRNNIHNFDPSKLHSAIKWEARAFYNLMTGRADHKIDYIFRNKCIQDFRDIPDTNFNDIRDALTHLYNILKTYGINEIFVADLTQHRMPTVRVIVPELEFIPKFDYVFKTRQSNERRLYQVPIKLGYKENIDFIYKSGFNNNFLI